MPKTMSVRLTDERADVLAAVSEASGTSQNQLINEGIDAVVDKYRADDEFKKRVAAQIERHQAVLDLLA